MGAKKLRLRVTQASLNQTAFDFPRNLANIYEAVRIAARDKSDILALEELALTGYDAGDDFQRTDNRRILAHLNDIAAYAAALDPNLIISIGHPWRLQMRNIPFDPDAPLDTANDPLFNRVGLPFNVQSIITGGRIQAMTAKGNLFNYERGYEKRHFQEWSMQSANRIGGVFGTIKIDVPGQGKVPFGVPILAVTDGADSFNLSQAICEQKWVGSKYDGNGIREADYPRYNIIPAISRRAGGRDGLVMMIADASPPGPGKIVKHEDLVRLASEYADVVINTDGLGSSGSTFAQFGHRLVGQGGKIVAAGARNSFSRVATTTTTVEINAASAALLQAVHGKVSHEFRNAAARVSPPRREHEWDRPGSAQSIHEETVRMTALWLFDYMRKTKSSGIAEALSGGADSAFNCVMVSAMVHLAVRELGVEGFCSEMGHLPYKNKILEAARKGGEKAAIDECMRHMLTAVYMGTNNSSEKTRNAARTLMEGAPGIEGIGGKYMERNVQDLLDFYGLVYAVEDTTTLSDARMAALRHGIADFLNIRPGSVSPAELERKSEAIKARYPEVQQLVSVANPAELIAYENIQARGRQVLIMMIANTEGKMAIANPNLDEARNAYATYGGDLHSGTINLNGHLPKAFQLEIMQYLHDHGLKDVMAPVKALGPVLKNKPTAELQPRNEAGEVVQNDEDALKGSFTQLNRVADYMLTTMIEEDDGPRRMNAGELFDRCRTDELFKGIDDDTLYDMICFRYARWAVAQHKIHASPVTPTYGSNVDHQTSLRTPNLNGGGRDELAALGLRLLQERARRDGIALTGTGGDVMAQRRAEQDEGFIARFNSLLRSHPAGLDFDLGHVYHTLRVKGWDEVFPPLPPSHHLSVIAGGPKQPSP